MRRGAAGVLAACAFGVAAGAVAMPAANAAPCSASGFATTASGVLGAAGGYLDTHPGANDVLTRAASQPAGEAESSVRDYFTAHPNEYVDLQGIVAPLKDLRGQCGVAVTPSQLALLLDEL
jgi:hemophore-related protein